MKDIFERAFKTFFETLVPSLLANAASISSGLTNYGWEDWKAWLLPIIVPVLATALSAAWNSVQNYLVRKNGSEDSTK